MDDVDDGVITVRKVRNELRRHRYAHANEVELHGGIATVLRGLGLIVQHEVRFDADSRIDLTTELPRPGGRPVRLGLEVKVAGNPSDVRRQLQRYARHDGLDALLLVTTIYSHAIGILPHLAPVTAGNAAGSVWTLGAMPFDVAVINRGLL